MYRKFQSVLGTVIENYFLVDAFRIAILLDLPFDALSRIEQYKSLCFIKFKFMDQTILLIRKATFLF